MIEPVSVIGGRKKKEGERKEGILTQFDGADYRTHRKGEWPSGPFSSI